MVFEQMQRIGAKDVGAGNLLRNRAILEYLENVAGGHADSVGYGINSIEKTHLSWLLLDWQVDVISRPRYGDKLLVRTWSQGVKKYYGYRGFEILDGEGKRRVSALSKWVLINTDKLSPIRASEDVMEKYTADPGYAYADAEAAMPKLRPPRDAEPDLCTQYRVMRRDIDIFGHMHNIYYLDLAYEALPEEVYAREREFDNIRINYSSQVKLSDLLRLSYYRIEDMHTVVISSAEGGEVHAIIELK